MVGGGDDEIPSGEGKGEDKGGDRSAWGVEEEVEEGQWAEETPAVRGQHCCSLAVGCMRRAADLSPGGDNFAKGEISGSWHEGFPVRISSTPALPLRFNILYYDVT